MKCKVCGGTNCMAHGSKVLPRPKMKFEDGGKVPAPPTKSSGPSPMKQAKEGFEKSGGLPSWDQLKDNVKHAFDPAPSPAGMAEGGEVDGDLDEMVADELMNAFKSGDKKALVSAIRAIAMGGNDDLG